MTNWMYVWNAFLPAKLQFVNQNRKVSSSLDEIFYSYLGEKNSKLY